eukprot:GHVP01026940.1.p1 GENE.GHVP01026940.1~~GHVP01026940.1.p1  ORF type:complete len:402 (-),score=72.93 GHVP01026940.1:361-1566(-)
MEVFESYFPILVFLFDEPVESYNVHRATSNFKSRSAKSEGKKANSISHYALMFGAATLALVSFGGIAWWLKRPGEDSEAEESSKKIKNRKSKNSMKSRKKFDMPIVNRKNYAAAQIKQKKIVLKDFDSLFRLAFEEGDLSNMKAKDCFAESEDTKGSNEDKKVHTEESRGSFAVASPESTSEEKAVNPENSKWNLKFEGKFCEYLILGNGHSIDKIDVYSEKFINKKVNTGFRIKPSVWTGEKFFIPKKDYYWNFCEDPRWNKNFYESYQSFKGLIPDLSKILQKSPRLYPDKEVRIDFIDRKLGEISFRYECPQGYNLAPIITELFHSFLDREEHGLDDYYIVETNLMLFLHRVLIELERGKKGNPTKIKSYHRDVKTEFILGGEHDGFKKSVYNIKPPN